ncbi:hypothetical protein L7F22_065198 [Adiantum nelumboides]|nr:hypothetical protein [Adiantum nelumboides]
MKLITHLISCSCILLFCFTNTCSQFTTAQMGSPCRKLKNLDKCYAFSALPSRKFTTSGEFLHTNNEDHPLQKFSWSLSSSSFQASIGKPARGSQFVRAKSDLELLEDGKLLLQKSKATLQMQASRLDKIKQLFFSMKRVKLLQESQSLALNEGASFNSGASLASNQSGSPSLTTDSSGSSSTNPDNGSHRDKKALAMEIFFPVVGFLLLLALCSALFCRRLKSKAKVSTINKSNPYSNSVQKSMTRVQEDEVLLDNLASAGLPPRFTYAEMEKATNGFVKKLGEGGYGAVFEGELSASGTRIAVKVFLDTTSTACRNGFCKEVMSIGEKKHQNLVQLRGYCVEDEHRMLVYELMENGSLNKLLFGGKAGEKSKELNWERRRAIAIDTARALAFLHDEEGEQKRPLIHCDVKPENILLNENWVAKVSDFGLAKLLWGASNKHHDDDHPDGDSDGRHTPSAHDGSSTTWDTGCLSGLVSSKGIRGTLGYLAPEWVRIDIGPDSITTASDVFSFGVVLLELVAGRRSMVPRKPFLLGQAFDMLANEDDLSNLLDPHVLEGSPLGLSPQSLEDARNFVKIALWCLQEDITLRPTMESIVTMLTNKELIASPPFCDYFAGSSHFFDEVDHPLKEVTLSLGTFNSHSKEQKSFSPTSYGQGSWQISILSGR